MWSYCNFTRVILARLSLLSGCSLNISHLSDVQKRLEIKWQLEFNIIIFFICYVSLTILLSVHFFVNFIRVIIYRMKINNQLYKNSRSFLHQVFSFIPFYGVKKFTQLII